MLALFFTPLHSAVNADTPDSSPSNPLSFSSIHFSRTFYFRPSTATAMVTTELVSVIRLCQQDF